MKTLIVCHDAGGAEVVSAWVKANPHHEYLYLLEGPAGPIFFKKLGLLLNHERAALALLLTEVDFVLTATSWASDLERYVIKVALARDVYVVSYLDHWCSYQERFLNNQVATLPNEIWVGDIDAEVLARGIFKETPIRLVPNQYFEEIKRELENINPVQRAEKINVLYVCQPVIEHALKQTGNENYWGYTEFSALLYFFECVASLGFSDKLNCIKLRLHPSETKDKYKNLVDTVMEKCACKITYSEETSLFEDFIWADWIVGVSSMALFMASLAQKVVFTCVPAGASVVRLPIKRIHDFNKTSINEALDLHMAQL